MANQTELQLIITAQNKAMNELAKLNKDVQGLSQSAQSSSKSFSGLLPNLAMLGGAYAFVKKGIIDSVKAFDQSEKVIAEMNAVLKSTGAVSGMTSESMMKLAGDLQNVTTFDDEAILHTENLILTFNQMGKDVIPQVTESILDLAQMMGGDLQGATMQVAKAMQDPERGLMMLRKSGVSFTDEQVRMIKSLYETGKAMEGQKMILQELQKEFGGQARAALETFGGRMKWLQNQISDAQEGIGKSIVNSITVALSGADLSAEKAKETLAKFRDFLMKWIPAFVVGLKWFGQMVINVGKVVYDFMYSVVSTVVAFGADIVRNIQNLGKNFEIFFGAINKAIHGDFQGAWNDMVSMTKDGVAVTSSTIKENMQTMKNDVGAFSKDTNSAIDSMNKAWQMNGENVKSVGSGIAQTQEYVGKSAQEMANKVKEATKKIKDLKSQFSDAVKAVKNDMKSLTAEFNKNELEKQKELGTEIAKAIIEKQKEKADLEKQLNEETDESNRSALQAKISDSQAFLDKHLGDQKTYQAQIIEEQRKASLDSIELLKEQYAEEKAQRLAEYKAKMSELKEHLNDVKKEYKKKLKELKEELKKEGLDTIKLKATITIDTEDNKKSKSHRAVGGSVMVGQEYVVGEHGAEIFRPTLSGTIEKIGGLSNAVSNTFNFNFAGAMIGDKGLLIKEIQRVIAREQELNKLGIR